MAIPQEVYIGGERMKIKINTLGWKIKHIKPRKLPMAEIISVETHKGHLPKDWRNRILTAEGKQ